MSAADWYVDHDPATSVLLLAPPGCGKTETLARYSHHLATTRHVEPPAQILALSYSRKSAASLRERLERYFGGTWTRYVDVRTFHSWAHRLVHAHGGEAGIELPARPPARYTVEQLLLGACGGDFSARDRAANVLRKVKTARHSDDEVAERLAATNHQAHRYHQRLRSAGMYDYDDLIGWARRTLAVTGVPAAYEHRFPVVVVDEVQDLTLAMLELTTAHNPSTQVFAGDVQQGIYRFSGADPDAVLRAIRTRSPREVTLSTSYRSSPAVLDVVTKLGRSLGAAALTASDPDAWSGRSSFENVSHDDPVQEAQWVADKVEQLLAKDHVRNVGVITRSKRRREFVDQEVEQRFDDVEVWDDHVHSPEAVAILQRYVQSVDAASPQPTDELRRLCLAEVPDDDFDLFGAINDALAVLDVDTAEELTRRISDLRVPSSDTEPVGPGVHLLNGHKGKGQEFDAVIVVGLEDYTLPTYGAIEGAKTGDRRELRDEQAVLRVMASRACYHLVFSRSAQLPRFKDGVWSDRDPSRFLNLL
jgi:DNA helicase-2/ATP-dependent DNA helicase PcrA